MEFLKKVSPKDWLYIGGAVASLIALAWLYGQHVNPGPGVQTDTPNDTLGDAGFMASPGYTTYNQGPVFPTPLANVPPGDTAAGACGCNTPGAMGCAGPSQLDTGTAYSGPNANDALYKFLQSINPTYAAAQAEQLQTYSEYFAAGATYDTGAGYVRGQVIA